MAAHLADDGGADRQSSVPVRSAFAVTFLGRLSQLTLGLVASVLIARALGPVDLGRFGLLWAVVLIASAVADAGLTYGGVKAIAQWRDRDPERARAAARAYARLRLSTGAAGAAALLVFAEPLSELLLGDVHLSTLLRVGAVTLLALGFGSYPGAVLVGLERFRHVAVASALNGAITLIGVAALAGLGRLDLESLVLWNAVLPLVSTIPAWLLLPGGWWPWRTVHGRTPVERTAGGRTTEPRSGVTGELLATSRWMFPAIVGSMIAAQADILVLGRFADPVALGPYVLAVTLAMRLDVINQTVVTVLVPRASRLADATAMRSYVRSTLLGTGALAAALIPLAVLGTVLIVPVYGPAFAPAGVLLVALVALVALDLVAGGMSMLAFPLDRPRILAITEWLRVIALVLVGLALIPPFAAVGAIAARGASRATGAAYAILAVRSGLRRGGAGAGTDAAWRVS